MWLLGANNISVITILRCWIIESLNNPKWWGYLLCTQLYIWQNIQNNYVLVTYLLDHCWYLLVQHLFEGSPSYAAVHLTQATISAREKEQMIKLNKGSTCRIWNGTASLWSDLEYQILWMSGKRSYTLSESTVWQNTHCFATGGQNLFFNEGREDCNATAVYNALSWPNSTLAYMNVSLIQRGSGLSDLCLIARVWASNLGEGMLLR